jgi:hypothetical protein
MIVEIGEKATAAPATDVARMTVGTGQQDVAIKMVSRQTHRPAVAESSEHARYWRHAGEQEMERQFSRKSSPELVSCA